ncbi:Hypothetical_protein [Hexamita inflata]|uniref:Hypothetical_protein n=1 Tax=Hexamita inflata TaxID=28002 RepID=A0AA86U3C3_9EUKA|nr:Hypothetical protein HINF_LOCUS26634 [Hexamita inflata]CAI9938994.1 Hypothetical protein HINF_LOCUS26639 [Hexamita inflata]
MREQLYRIIVYVIQQFQNIQHELYFLDTNRTQVANNYFKILTRLIVAQVTELIRTNCLECKRCIDDGHYLIIQYQIYYIITYFETVGYLSQHDFNSLIFFTE